MPLTRHAYPVLQLAKFWFLTYVYVVDPGAELWPDKIVGLRGAGKRLPFPHACCVLVLLPGVVYYMGVQFEKRGWQTFKAQKMRKNSAQRAVFYYIDFFSLPSQLAQVRTVGPRRFGASVLA